MVSVSGLARQTIKPWNSCVLKVGSSLLGDSNRAFMEG